MRNTDLKCLKRVIVVELHSGLSLDMTYTLSFAVADLLWIFICGIDLRLKSHRDIHDHLNPAPTYHTDLSPSQPYYLTSFLTYILFFILLSPYLYNIILTL